MKFTPGPWNLQECSNGGMILLRPSLEGQRHAIQSHLQILPTEDARLMAAAPELLEACKSTLEAIESWHNFHDHTDSDIHCDDICKKMPALKAAIAKAEGK